jgi:glycosyltransferase involved in cell wall biosynthesis
LVIIDDASQDNSANLINEFAGNNSSVEIIVNKVNLGNIENIHFGISKILSDNPELKFFSLLGPDDLYEKDWLSNCVNALSCNPRAVGAQTWSEYFWTSGAKFVNRYESISSKAKFSILNQTLKLSDKTGNPIRYSNFIGGLMKVEFVQEYLAHDVALLESLFLWEDLIPLLMIKRGGIISIPELLFRKNKNSKGSKSDHNSKYPGADFSIKMNSSRAKIKALLLLEFHFLSIRKTEFLGFQMLVIIVIWNRSIRPKLSKLRRLFL